MAALLEVFRNRPYLRTKQPAAQLRACAAMYGLALWRNVPPVEFLAYDFGDPQQRAALPQYLFWTDGDAVKRLNRLRGARNEDVQDKARFAVICAAHGLPHVRTWASFGAGNTAGDREQDATAIAGWTGGFWVKPLRLQGGRGAERWLPAADGQFEDSNGLRLAPGALLARLRERACLVQPIVTNHPAVERFTNGALASLRVVTGLHRDGTPALLANLLVLPQGTSTISAGGLVCTVDWTSGTILGARDNSLRHTLDRHPETGERFPGAALPFWAETLALVQHAHREAFPHFATLGWDVALTPDGPLLLETNSGWGALAHQVMSGPLGLTALSAIVSEDLDAGLAANLAAHGRGR